VIRSPARPTSAKAAQVAYANAKLAILYYAHELQRHVGDQVHVLVLEPGFMPGTGLIREAGPVMQALLRAMGHLPGGTTPARSAPHSPRSSSTIAGPEFATGLSS
jgi:NAD(P)-dependent dehydrogenase (short-subunit alcohol dehydrogenase family)